MILFGERNATLFKILKGIHPFVMLVIRRILVGRWHPTAGASQDADALNLFNAIVSSGIDEDFVPRSNV